LHESKHCSLYVGPREARGPDAARWPVSGTRRTLAPNLCAQVICTNCCQGMSTVRREGLFRNTSRFGTETWRFPASFHSLTAGTFQRLALGNFRSFPSKPVASYPCLITFSSRDSVTLSCDTFPASADQSHNHNVRKETPSRPPRRTLLANPTGSGPPCSALHPTKKGGHCISKCAKATPPTCRPALPPPSAEPSR
jgi:hypothetical protein